LYPSFARNFSTCWRFYISILRNHGHKLTLFFGKDITTLLA
jgi:hypothetical protein